MEALAKFIGIVVLFIGMVAIAAIIFDYPVMWIMNYVFSSIFLMSIFGIAKMTFCKTFWFTFFMGLVVKSSSSSSSSSKN